MTRINTAFKIIEANYKLLFDFWEKSSGKQTVEIMGEKIYYLVICKDDLPIPEERKTFLGLVTRKFPGNMYNRELIIFIEDIVPQEYIRYVLIHEIEEGQRMGERKGQDDPHFYALIEQCRVAKKELDKTKFQEFINWLLIHIDDESKVVVNSFFVNI